MAVTISAALVAWVYTWPITIVLAIISLVAIVRLNRRPKDFPPGPRGWPIIGNVLEFGRDDDFMHALMRGYKEFGPVYTVQVGLLHDVVVNGADMIKTLLVKKGLDFADKPPLIEADMYNKDRKGIFVAHCGEGWQHQRQFAHTTLREMGFGKVSLEPIIQEEVADTIRQFKSYAGKPFDPQVVLATNASNIICRLIFGHRFQHNDPEFLGLMNHLRTIMSFRSEEEVMVFPFLKHLYAYRAKWRNYTKSNDQLAEYFGTKIDEHRKSLDERTTPKTPYPDINDFIDAYLVHARENPDHFNDGELKVVLSDLFLAGSDTVSTTLSWAILYMAAHPDIQKKAQAEIDKVVGDGSILLSHRSDMPYAEATRMEFQRLASVIPINPHSAYTDSELGGYKIPKGTRIWINMWSLFRDPVEYPNPDKCDPTRFLSKDGTKVLHRDGFMPFSAGRRVCMGELLAKMELFLFFTSLLQNFTFQFSDPEYVPSFEGVVGINRQPRPFMVRAVPRVKN